MPSPHQLRRRPNSQDGMSRQLSSDSLDNLLGPVSSLQRINMLMSNNAQRGRRHSVACGISHMELQKKSLKSAFNSAMKRMSSACSVLSSAPSSTYNLSPHVSTASSEKQKEEPVKLPAVLGTFNQSCMPQKPPHFETCKTSKMKFQVNRRFSTDLPPPSYVDATNVWKEPVSKQKLSRHQNILAPKPSLVEDEDSPQEDC